MKNILIIIGLFLSLNITAQEGQELNKLFVSDTSLYLNNTNYTISPYPLTRKYTDTSGIYNNYVEISFQNISKGLLLLRVYKEGSVLIEGTINKKENNITTLEITAPMSSMSNYRSLIKELFDALDIIGIITFDEDLTTTDVLCYHVNCSDNTLAEVMYFYLFK